MLIREHTQLVEKQTLSEYAALSENSKGRITPIEDASNKLTLADNYTEGQNLKQGLTNASQEIKDALAWAAQAAKEADLDYNGDGKVNVQDLLDADAEFQNSGDGFTFYKFFDAYLESLSK